MKGRILQPLDDPKRIVSCNKGAPDKIHLIGHSKIATRRIVVEAKKTGPWNPGGGFLWSAFPTILEIRFV